MAPSFFVILLNPSSGHLPLPLVENKIPEGPVIISANGGYWWSLMIKKINGKYYFTNGWNNVVQDIKLCLGDFLYFQPLDQSMFRMFVHTQNGCEKALPSKVDHVGSSGVNGHVLIEDEDDDEEDDDDPCFKLTITKSHTSVLRLPSEFARLAGINGVGTMAIKNLDGQEWHVNLKVEVSHGHNRYYLSGCNGFRRENGLSDGDECVFKFVRSEGKLLLAEINKQEEGNVDVEDDDDDDDDPCFTFVITKTRLNMLRFPVEFARLVGMDGEGKMVIRNVDGREWRVSLRVELSHGWNRYYLSTGWKQCWRENGLSEGDECLIMFVRREGKLLLAKITKHGVDVENEEACVEVGKRPRGRPPKQIMRRGTPPQQNQDKQITRRGTPPQQNQDV